MANRKVKRSKNESQSKSNLKIKGSGAKTKGGTKSAKKLKQKQKQFQTVNIKIGGAKEQQDQPRYPTVISNTHYVPQTNNENMLLQLINSVKEHNRPLPIPPVFSNKIGEDTPNKSLLKQATEPRSKSSKTLFSGDLSNILDDDTQLPIENNEEHITVRKKTKGSKHLNENTEDSSMAVAVPIYEEDLRRKGFNKPRELFPDTENEMSDPFNGVINVDIRDRINQMFGNDKKQLARFIQEHRSQFINPYSNMRRSELIKLHHMVSESKMS